MSSFFPGHGGSQVAGSTTIGVSQKETKLVATCRFSHGAVQFLQLVAEIPKDRDSGLSPRKKTDSIKALFPTLLHSTSG